MSKPEIIEGFRASLPILISAGPFGLLFGAIAVDNGMTTGEAVLMSAAMFAGASQMVGIELFGQKVAPWLIVLSIVAINFRHILYSASVGRQMTQWGFWQKAAGFFLLTDPQYAETERRAEKGRSAGAAWYFGLGLPIYLFWVAEAWIGAEFGKLVKEPETLGIDFLLPIYFIGMVLAFRKRPMWLPVVATSSVIAIIAYNTVGSPWHVSFGAAGGVFVAACFPPKQREA